MKTSFYFDSSVCQGLIYSVLQDPSLKIAHRGLTVALVAPHQGAGSTYITNMLAESLNVDGSKSALVLDCAELVSLTVHSKQYTDVTGAPQSAAQPYVPSFSGNWRGSFDFRSTYLHQLRERFQYVLIDCPSLKESTDALSLARLVDGFFIVVEANRTHKSQLAYLERTLERAGGKIFGHLLNKRTYPIPEWIHAQIESWG